MTTTIQPDLDRLITEEKAAEYLGVTRRALQAWRLSGKGPQFVKISQRCVRYRLREINIWAEQKLRSSTSEKVDVIEEGMK